MELMDPRNLFSNIPRFLMTLVILEFWCGTRPSENYPGDAQGNESPPLWNGMPRKGSWGNI